MAIPFFQLQNFVAFVAEVYISAERRFAAQKL
jgi:hypothetical protein